MSVAIIKKRPTEQYSIGLKFQPPDLVYDQKIIGVETSVVPVEVGGLELLGSPTIGGLTDEVAQVIGSGNDLGEYRVKFKVTTSLGDIFEEEIMIIIREIE